LGLLVCGEWFANSAAKFWPWLVDDALAEFPDCAQIELSLYSGKILHRKLLYPERSLQRELEQLMRGQLHRSWEDTLAELEMLGGPCAVNIRLLGDTDGCVLREEPSDTIDSETFPYLAIWLLQWADIPEKSWNREFIEGFFSATDPIRDSDHSLSFTLRSRHISEGLYHRTLELDLSGSS